jgi:Tol biopolymer transport system component
MQPDGSSKPAIGPNRCGYPSWTADSQKVLHLRGIAEGGGIFTMDLAGENAIEIHRINEDQIWKHPHYSPDGRSIVVSIQFVSGPMAGLPEIWILNADGTGLRRLTSRGGAHPAWSSDGTSIVFARADYHRNVPETGVLWIVNVASGVESQRTVKWPERCPTSVEQATWSDLKARFRR